MADIQTLASPDPKTLKSSPMADIQTLASPDPSSASSKKKRRKKKRKVNYAAAATEPEPVNVTVDSATAPETEPINVTVDAVATPETEPINVTVEAAAAPKPEPINVTVDAAASEPEPEPEPINVTVDASLTGGSAASAAAPVVAYLPSGYDPLAASKSPSARLFRNVTHPSRIDLVVRSPGGGPDFVGRSYAGEAALPQLCNYALGVFDKVSGTLKVVPVASNKIPRLEPYVEVQKPAHSQNSGVASEACSAVATGEMKVQDLTSLYGAKKDKETDKKWRSLNEQRNDPSAYLNLDLGEPVTNANASDNQAPAVVQNVPPYDPTADTPEKAYRFDEIIPKNIRPHLLEILGHLESGEFSSKGYGSFVSSRVHKLEKLQGEDKERLAWILSYITHLLTFLRTINISNWYKKKIQAKKAPAVPPAVYRKMLAMFTEEGSSALSTEKKELLINYVLVLTLFADDFRSDPRHIAADLRVTSGTLKPYFNQLGCKVMSAGAFEPSFMTLPIPLKVSEKVASRKQRRKSSRFDIATEGKR